MNKSADEKNDSENFIRIPLGYLLVEGKNLELFFEMTICLEKNREIGEYTLPNETARRTPRDSAKVRPPDYGCFCGCPGLDSGHRCCFDTCVYTLLNRLLFVGS